MNILEFALKNRYVILLTLAGFVIAAVLFLILDTTQTLPGPVECGQDNCAEELPFLEGFI